MGIATNKYIKRLDLIKKGVIKQFGRENANTWRNRDFEDLSFEVNKVTRVLISAATLKRIFGKSKTSETYYPQESTLDALEKYAAINKFNEQTKLSKSKYLVVLIPVAVIIIGLLILFFSTDKIVPAEVHVEVSLLKVEGTNPATAFFKYANPDTEDSMFISFNDGHPLRYLLPESTSVSHVYNYPGLFHVNLQSSSHIISDTLKVLVPTNGWQAMASYYQQDYRDRYYPIPLQLAQIKAGFHLTRKILNSIGLDTTKILVISLDNYKKTQTNGDSFTLKTRLKNVNYWPAVRCYSAYIKLVGENGTILFKLTNEGCSGFGEFILSEKLGHGSNTDLSGLTLNIKNWNDIEIRNEQKNVSLLVNNEIVFRENYTKSIGNILGVSLQFHGSGYVEYLELSDIKKQLLFQQNFKLNSN